MYNLKKMMKFSASKVKVVADMLDKIERNIQKSFFLALQAIRAILKINYVD